MCSTTFLHPSSIKAMRLRTKLRLLCTSGWNGGCNQITIPAVRLILGRAPAQAEPDIDTAHVDEFNRHCEGAWVRKRDPRHDTPPPQRPMDEREPDPGGHDIEAAQSPDILEQSLTTHVFSIFGDPIPHFVLR